MREREKKVFSCSSSIFFFLYFSQRNRFLYFGSLRRCGGRSVGLWSGMLMSSEGARAKAQWRKRIVMTGPAELSSSSRCKEPKRRRRFSLSLFSFLIRESGVKGGGGGGGWPAQIKGQCVVVLGTVSNYRLEEGEEEKGTSKSEQGDGR